MRKIAYFLFIVLFSFLYAKEPITLKIWEGFKFEEHNLFEKLMKQYEDNYNKTHTQKIKIKVERVPFDDMITKIKMACLARRTPDLAVVDALKVIELAYGKVIIPINKLENFRYKSIEDAKKEFVPAAFETNVIDIKGKVDLYGLPAQATTLALFWNKEIFQKYKSDLLKAGLDPSRAPITWDEFVKYAKALTHPKDKVYGYAMANSLWFTFPIINTYYGKILIKENGKWKSNFNSKLVKAALRRNVNFYLKDKIEAGAWQSGAIGPDQGFINGSYAMILMGPWNVERFKSSGVKFGISLIPKLSKREAIKLGLIPASATDEEYNKKITSSSNIGGNDFVIFRTCKVPEIAYDIIEYFTSEKIQKLWAEKLGQIPVRLSAQKNLNLKNFPEIPLFIKQINLARPLPKIPLYGTLESDIFNPEMDLVLQKKQSLDEGIKKIDKKFKKLILDKMNE